MRFPCTTMFSNQINLMLTLIVAVSDIAQASIVMRFVSLMVCVNIYISFHIGK